MLYISVFWKGFHSAFPGNADRTADGKKKEDERINNNNNNNINVNDTQMLFRMPSEDRGSPQCNNNILLFDSHAFVCLFLVYLFFVLFGRHFFPPKSSVRVHFGEEQRVCLSREEIQPDSNITWIPENGVHVRSVFQQRIAAERHFDCVFL